MRLKSILSITILSLVFVTCSSSNKRSEGVKDSFETVRKAFKKEIDGKQVDLFQLKNDRGMIVTITNYGGRIVSLVVPDKNGKPVDVVLGYDNIEDYLISKEPYFGALIGRNGNRIANAHFAIDEQNYSLAKNNGSNNLHGGPKGFHNQVWEVKNADDRMITLKYLSKDGEEGFPGNLEVEVYYLLTDDNELIIDYQAKTDQTTPVNLTNHAFFNLNGDASGTINGHVLQIMASQYTPVDATLIPLGFNADVSGTPFDFKEPTLIGLRVNDESEQLSFGLGYDHNFVLDKSVTEGAGLAAVVYSDKTGISMTVNTTEPGLQFYGGNFLNGEETGKHGVYTHRTAFCLETQHFPDAVNQPNFLSTLLHAGEKYATRSTYEFGINEDKVE